jgi:hypothetical protein
MRKVQKPAAGEYASFASAIFNLDPDDELVFEHLRANLQMVNDLVSHLPDSSPSNS